MAQAFNKTGVGNFLENTGFGRALDFATDFVPILGTLKNLGLGAYSLFDDDKENVDWGRIVGGGLGAFSPLIGKGVGKLLTNSASKLATNAGVKQAAKLAGSSVDDVLKASAKLPISPIATKTSALLNKAGAVSNYMGTAGKGVAKGWLAQGAGNFGGKIVGNNTDADLKQQAETADIMNSDLVTGKYLDTLLNDLNTETTSEYDKYAQELARKEEQDKASAVYSGMNAGNIGLSNLLKGNIGNAYNQLSKQALNEMTKQKSSNRLNAMSQTDNQFNSLLSLAQNTGNNDLLEKLLLAKTNQLTKGN